MAITVEQKHLSIENILVSTLPDDDGFFSVAAKLEDGTIQKLFDYRDNPPVVLNDLVGITVMEAWTRVRMGYDHN